jgi:hypothetical protein
MLRPPVLKRTNSIVTPLPRPYVTTSSITIPLITTVQVLGCRLVPAAWASDRASPSTTTLKRAFS